MHAFHRISFHTRILEVLLHKTEGEPPKKKHNFASHKMGYLGLQRPQHTIPVITVESKNEGKNMQVEMHQCKRHKRCLTLPGIATYHSMSCHGKPCHAISHVDTQYHYYPLIPSLLSQHGIQQVAGLRHGHPSTPPARRHAPQCPQTCASGRGPRGRRTASGPRPPAGR